MSYNNKKDRVEERVYSVTMTEEELRLFSEFLEQRCFDGEGMKEVRKFLTASSPDEVDSKRYRVYKDQINRNLKEAEEALQRARTMENDYLLHQEAEKAAELQSRNKMGRGLDARYYLEKYKDDIKGTEEEEILKKLSEEGKDHIFYIDKDFNFHRSRGENDLSKKYIESSKIIRDYNSNSRLKKDLFLNTNTSKKYNPKTDKPLVEIDEDVPIITEPEEEDNDTLALADQVRFNEEQKKKLISDNENTGKKYDPKTDKPLVEINEDVPIITEPEEKERTKELNKFQRNRKREDFINKMKEVPGKIKNKYDSLSDKYSENFDGRSLGKDAAIAAGATAALGAGAYGLHKYLKKKKADKKKAEDKFKK